MSDNCKVCGKPKGRNKYFCSKACESKYRQHQRICPVCGKSFATSPANDTVCCSPECSSIHRKQLHKNGKYDTAIAKWQKEKEKFFEEHSGEKHINAKHWIIKSPDGQIYDCQNLLYFIKQNPDLFDGTPKQAFDGFAKIKASIQGKRKNPCYTWKGWHLISWN